MEIEVKARLKNIPQVRSRLKALGAKRVGDKREVDAYYSPKSGQRFVGKNLHRLRIREDKTNKKARFEYHIPVGVIGGHEFEVEVSDAEIMRQILEKLGYCIEAVIDKKRETFKKGEITIVLDRVKSLGNYIEVEILTNKTKQAEKKIYAFYNRLEIPEEDLAASQRYLDMMLKAKKRM
ncbi:MAG: class IV adenylate cyclase [Patescibacteria group bacterium]